MIDCRKLEGTDRDKNLEIHVGRNSRIMKSFLGSKDYHELHSHLYVGISRFFSAENVLIMICENGRRNFCCERRVVVKYVESLRQMLSLRFTDASAIFGKTHAPESVQNAEAVFQNLSNTLRLRSCRMFTPCRSDRFGDIGSDHDGKVFSTRRRTELLAKSVHFSRAK